MRHSLVVLVAAVAAAQNANPPYPPVPAGAVVEAEQTPQARGFEYAQLWFGDTYTVGVGINAQQYTRAVVCYFQESGCRFGVVEVQRRLIDQDSRYFARYLGEEAVAKAAAILGRQGWKLIATTEDQKLGVTLMFRRRAPRADR